MDANKGYIPPYNPITQNTPRDAIASRIRRINSEAMTVSRKGYIGLQSEKYKNLHADINQLLYMWQLAQQ